MNAIIVVDQALLGLFERLSHRIQRLCGLDNIQVARICLGFTCFVPVVVYGPMGLISLLFYFLVVGTHRTRDKKIRRDACLGYKNQLAEPSFFDSALRLWMFHYGLLELSHMHPLIFGLGLYTYFRACTPLPPGTSKLKNFLRSLKTALVLIPQASKS